MKRETAMAIIGRQNESGQGEGNMEPAERRIESIGLRPRHKYETES
jgi:hypothetical protein